MHYLRFSRAPAHGLLPHVLLLHQSPSNRLASSAGRNYDSTLQSLQKSFYDSERFFSTDYGQIPVRMSAYTHQHALENRCRLYPFRPLSQARGRQRPRAALFYLPRCSYELYEGWSRLAEQQLRRYQSISRHGQGPMVCAKPTKAQRRPFLLTP